MIDIDGDSHGQCRSRRISGRQAAVARLALRQHGVVARRQLLGLGVTADVVDWWVRTARLHVVRRGVYAVGDRALPPLGPVMAAVLACGPGAVASHRSAAWLWSLLPDARQVIDVTVTSGRRGQRGIVLHHARSLDEGDVTEVDGVPATALPRTLLDLAETARPADLDRAIEEADRRRIFDLAATNELLARSHGRRGATQLREALRELTGPPPMTRSELEHRFKDLITKAGLPPPSQNVLLHGYEVDALWETAKLVIELDGFASPSNEP